MRTATPSRAIPAVSLAICAGVFLWLYSDYLAGQSTPNAAFLLPPIAALALGGLFDPRLMWSIGPRRRQFPRNIRIGGALIFTLGLAISALLLVWPRLH